MAAKQQVWADRYLSWTAPLDWAPREASEVSEWGIDPGSGAAIRRLTAGACYHDIIYCEQPYTSSDGRRIAICRSRDSFLPGCELIVADVVTGQMWMVEPSIVRKYLANAAYTGWIYYHTHDGGVRRVSLTTLEKQQVIPAGKMPVGCQLFSITPDQSTALIHDSRQKAAPALSTVSFATGEHTVIYRDSDNKNPHAQLDRADGSKILFQKCDWTKKDFPLEVFVHDRKTGQRTELPFGGRPTANPSGHMSWIGETDSVACLVEWRRGERLHDPRHPAGNLAIARPGDETPRVIGGAGHAYWQIAISRCGRYFLCNDFMEGEGNYRAGTDVLHDGAQPAYRGAIRLVAGSFATGRTRTLIADAPGSGRGHYFTADNKHVVYAATAWGQWHVFAAAVPEGFLDNLDEE
jgi:hypothetical protein